MENNPIAPILYHSGGQFMTVNLFTFNEIKKTTYAEKLYKVLGNYIFEYVFNDENEVKDEDEEKVVELLQECNQFAEALRLPELCGIYDVFRLEQDVMILYSMVTKYLIKDKQGFDKLQIITKLEHYSNL